MQSQVNTQPHADAQASHHLFKVGVVVVTFNRRELLQNTLQSLDRQTYPIEQILVIDNASTDGTRDYLSNLKMSRCEAIFMEKNLGGAGGFAAGIEAAYTRGADLIWVMDDDVLPENDALEKLIHSLLDLRAKGMDPNFVICNVFNAEGEPVNAPVIDLRLQRNGNLRVTTFLGDGLLPAVSASFVGPLFTREAVARHGLPIAEMFIWGDDTEYTFRLTSEREAGYVVGNSRIVHLGRGAELSLVNENDPGRAAKFFYFYRNNTYVLRKYGNKQKTAAFTLACIRDTLKLLVRLDMRKLGILLGGIAAGLRFNPKIKMVD